MVLSAKVAAIELSEDKVRLVVVKTGGKLPKVLEAHTCYADFGGAEPHTEGLVQALKNAVGGLRNRPTAYVLCVSGSHALVRTVPIPFRGKSKVASAVQFEIERYLAIPIEELIVDFLPVLEIEGQTEVLAVGIRRSVLKEQLDILAAAGIEPESIDVDATGVAGLWRAGHPSLKGLNALLYCGETGSALVLTHNKTLAYFRHLTFSAAQFHQRLGPAAREVENSLRAFHANWRGGGEVLSLSVAGVNWTGNELESFQQAFDIPVTPVDMLAKVKGNVKALRVAPNPLPIVPDAPYSEALEEEPVFDPPNPAPLSDWTADAVAIAHDPDAPKFADMSEWARVEPPSRKMDALKTAGTEEAVVDPEVEAARAPIEEPAEQPAAPADGLAWEPIVGTALGAAGGGFSLNFRKQELAYTKVFSGLVPHVMAASCLVLLLLLGMAWGYRYGTVRLNADAEDLRQKIDAVRKDIEEKQNHVVNVDSDLFADPSLLDILNEISQKMPDEKATITDFKIEPVVKNGPWITIRGNVKDDAVFDTAFNELRQSKLFKVDDDAGKKMEQGQSTFRITIRKNETDGSAK